MEFIIFILSILVLALIYKVRLLTRHLIVLSFSNKNINKLLVKNELITESEIDIVINESIGDMDPEEGDRLIKYAKSIGIRIPEYMGEEDLEEYVKVQQVKRDKIRFAKIMSDQGVYESLTDE